MKGQNWTRVVVIATGILLWLGPSSLAALPSSTAGLSGALGLLWAASSDSTSSSEDAGSSASSDERPAEASKRHSSYRTDTVRLGDQLPTLKVTPIGGEKSLDPTFPANNLVATIPAQGSVTIEFEVQVKAYNQWAGFPLTQICDQHTVTASGGISVVTDDPAVGGLIDPTCIGLDTADLSISKTDSVDPVVAGSPLAYTVTVSNSGPADAESVVVTDILPAGVTFVSTSGCTEDPAGVPTCTLGSIANAGMKQYTVNVTVDDSTTGTITNNVSVTSAREAAPGNETASEDTTVNGQADLTITKSDSADPVNAGDPLVYTVTVANSGPSTAENVVVTDTLPSGLSAVTTSGCAEDPVGVPTCTLGSIASGASDQYTISVTVDPTTNGTITNTAAVASSTTLVNTSDDTVDEDTFVNGEASLSMTKTDAPDPVLAGNQLTYSFSVDNTGPGSTVNTEVFDLLPAGTTFSSDTLGACTQPGTLLGYAASLDESAVSSGSLATGRGAFFLDTTTAVLRYVLDVDGMANAITSATLRKASDNSLVHDLYAGLPNFDNGNAISGMIQLTAQQSTDLQAETHYVDVRTAAFPAGEIRGDLAGSPGATVCDLGTIANAGNSSFDIVVDVDAGVADGSILSNLALATTTILDPNRVVVAPAGEISGARARADTDVDASADLVISKTDDVDPVVAGTHLVYTLSVTNNGPSDALDVVITDTLPAGVTLISTNGCNEDPTGVPICTLGTLTDGSTEMVAVTVAVGPGTAGLLTNNASVASSTTLTSTGDDSTSEDTTVVAQASLSSDKTDSSDPISAGEDLTYGLSVTNNGPSNASDVTLFDILPDDVTYVSDTAGCTQPGDLEGLRAILDPANEVPPVASSATGTASFVLDTTNEVLYFAIHVGTIDNIVAAHIHAGGPGSNLPPLFFLYSGTPLFDPGNPITGDIQLTTAEVTTLLANPHYVNVHTSDFPGGEIRGQIVPTINDVLSCAQGTVAPAATVDIDVVTSLASSLADGTVLENVLIGTSSTTDPNNIPIDGGGGGLVEPDAKGGVPPRGGFLRGTTAIEVTTVNAVADLAISKIDDVDPAGAGTPLTYTITVDNNGPSDALDVVVTDTLPAGLTFVSTTGCAEDPNGVPTCTLGTLVAGAQAQITVLVNIDPTTNGTITNTASVATSTTDPNGADNSVDEDTDVQAIADLSIIKSDSMDPVAGQSFTYTVDVANAGPSTATAVEVTDVLPSGLVFDSSPDGCTENLGTVTCVIGNMTSGQMESRSFVVNLMAPIPSVASNTATVAGAEFDPDLDNNSDTEETTLDVIPPTVTNINTFYDSGDGVLEECETVNRNWVQRLLVTFSETMFDPAGDSDVDDVTNPANYQLVAAGADRSFQTDACGGAQGDDQVIGVTSVSFDDMTFVADLTLALELPDDLYRLEVCGSTTLVDLAGNALDGDGNGTGGDDFERGFRVDNANYFANGHFDCDLDSWNLTSSNPAEIVYDSDDFEDSAQSGSAQMENLTQSQAFEIDQCAAVLADGDHRFSVSLRLAAGDGIAITASRSCEFFDAMACGGNSLGPIFGATQLFDSGGTFNGLDTTFTAPTTAVSARCAVTLSTAAGESFVANVDAMTLVTEGEIFGDGFESGDLSAWSSVVP